MDQARYSLLLHLTAQSQAVIPPIALDLEGAEQLAALIQSICGCVITIDQIQHPQRRFKREASQHVAIANLLDRVIHFGQSAAH